MFSMLLKSEFIKNILSLSLASVVAQIINFFLTTILTRIYSPYDFGLLTIFLSVASIIGVFATGKFDVAIVVAKTRNQAISLVRLSFFISLLFSLLVFIVIIIFKPIIIQYFKHPEITNWFYYLPLMLFFTSVSQIFWMWNVREKKFKDISMLRILETSSNGGFSILFKPLGTIGLLFGTLISQLVSSLFLGIKIFVRDKFNLFKFIKKDMKENALLYLDFPKYNILQGLCDMFLIIGIVLIGSRYLSVEVMGFYALALRVLQLPVGIIVRPIAHVFFAEASEKYRNGENLYQLTRKTIINMLLLGSIIPTILFIAGPFLFSIIFGKQWYEAGVIAKILSIWIFLDFVKAPVAQIAAIVGKQKLVLLCTLVVSIIFVLVIISSGYFFHDNPKIFFTIISTYQSIQTIFFILLFLKLSRKNVSL